MSKRNSSGSDTFGCVIWMVLILLLASYCGRRDKDKSFIDNSIEQVHEWTNHADSVWKGGDK